MYARVARDCVFVPHLTVKIRREIGTDDHGAYVGPISHVGC